MPENDMRGPEPAYSPVQLVTDGATSYLFHIRNRNLVCAIAHQCPPPEPFPKHEMSWVWREPLRGFTVSVDAGGALRCHIQTPDDRFLTAVSHDSAISWNYNRQHLKQPR